MKPRNTGWPCHSGRNNNTYIYVAPKTLNIVWAKAARLAFRFAPKEAKMAVIVVPMLSPKISGTAV